MNTFRSNDTPVGVDFRLQMNRGLSMRDLITRTRAQAIRILIAIALTSLAIGDLHAQLRVTERYPWDERPNKCFAPGAEPIGQCRPADNWPSPDLTVRYIFNLYANDTFVLLERYLSDFVASKKRFRSGEYPEEVIFRAFNLLMPRPAEDGSGLQRNAAWRKEVPDSKFVLFAEFALLRATAWNARGSGFADSVSKESWELFAIRLQEAEQVLLNAPQPLRESPVWHLALLAVALDSNRVQSDPREVFERAVKRWPTYAGFYQLMLGRMVPKWGGNWAQVESFISKWTKLQPASEGKSLYARLYISLIPERSAIESNFDWDMMKASFEDTIARFPDPKYKNLYASYACLAKDKALFSQAMSKISKDELIPVWWLPGNSYDSCVRWAGV